MFGAFGADYVVQMVDHRSDEWVPSSDELSTPHVPQPDQQLQLVGNIFLLRWDLSRGDGGLLSRFEDVGESVDGIVDFLRAIQDIDPACGEVDLTLYPIRFIKASNESSSRGRWNIDVNSEGDR